MGAGSGAQDNSSGSEEDSDEAELGHDDDPYNTEVAVLQQQLDRKKRIVATLKAKRALHGAPDKVMKVMMDLKVHKKFVIDTAVRKKEDEGYNVDSSTFSGPQALKFLGWLPSRRRTGTGDEGAKPVYLPDNEVPPYVHVCMCVCAQSVHVQHVCVCVCVW